MRKLVPLACLLVAFLAWAFWPGGGPTLPSPEPAAPGPAAASAAGTAEAAPGTVDGERTALAPATAERPVDPGVAVPARGQLLVHVQWSDQTPAADVRLAAFRGEGQPYGVAAVAVSDADGTARLPVPPGTYRLRSDRGGDVKVTVEAGQTQEMTFPIPAGLAVTGTVRDEAGAPVAAAWIWLTSHQGGPAGGRIVGQCDDRGAFALRDVPKDQSLGALATGFAPSELVDLEECDVTRQPVTVDLRLTRPGGGLQGLVLDPQGQPVAGATIAVGRSDRYVDYRSNHTTREFWQPRTAETGADGRFALAGLEPGKHPVEALAEDFPIWRGEVEITANATGELVVRLRAGVAVSGTVRGSGGVPLAAAVVRAYPQKLREDFLQFGQFDFDSVFGCAFAVSDAAGRYRVEHIAPGTIHLYAAPKTERSAREEVRIWDATELQGEDGGELAWDPLIDAGAVLEGVVTYRNGAPMSDVFVTAAAEDGDDATGSGRHVITTDKQGRFRHVRLQQVRYDVSVQYWSPPKGTPPLVRRGVFPGQGELRLVAPFDKAEKTQTAKVRGRVRDAAGRLERPAALAVTLNTSWGQYHGKLDGDAFLFDRVEPGRCHVVVRSNEAPIHIGSWFEVEAGADIDVGTLVTEPGGGLHVRVVRGAGTEGRKFSLSVNHEGGGYRSESVDGAASELRIDNLCVGTQFLSVHGEGIAAVRKQACTVTAGVMTPVTVSLVAAESRPIEVLFRADQEIRSLRIRDAAGEEVWSFEPGSYALPRPYRGKVRLPAGTFVLRAETWADASQEVAFAMGPPGGEPQPAVRLDLR